MALRGAPSNPATEAIWGMPANKRGYVTLGGQLVPNKLHGRALAALVSSGAAPTYGTRCPGPRCRPTGADGAQPEGILCLPLTTLMSRFNSCGHGCSSPIRSEARCPPDDRAWQGAAA